MVCGADRLETVQIHEYFLEIMFVNRASKEAEVRVAEEEKRVDKRSYELSILAFVSFWETAMT